MPSDEDDIFVTDSLAIYSSLNFKPAPGKFTIMASFALTSANNSTRKVIALSTGSKCLPEVRLPLKGDILHDCHAEVLARRCAVRWFLEEIARFAADQRSEWIERHPSGKFSLKEGLRMIMYISTVPCGDASMRYLASSQDDEMAVLKNSTVSLPFPPNTASRGRDNYSLYGVLRTKPGRADSPPTLSMSCSDKIATWNAIGIQGALGSRFFHPIYISKVIIGEVDEGMQELVRADCKRAFWERLESIHDFPADYQLHRPDVQFTTVIFPHSRTSLTPPSNSSCNESVCWIADSAKTPEVLINGGKRGVPPKHRYKTMFR
ncbi:hypothetical protein SERLADRAFT_434997 [Serpula lacrymans var. lacrymans S7.9]|nr:uncharacterized protein SERLADRAFT_434997 [Serpula lacrymans var. lacrymans S7.9]EGO27228.1 hypothetical protein SERLADRAFT_434997 [Serpula lacrymans var. lacrymans S7.9]